MMHSAKALSRYEVHATDGKIGQAIDLYFDDSNQEIRYLVVETGRWLPDKKLLIPRQYFGHVDPVAKLFSVNLSHSEAEDCQLMSQDLPISWKLEESLKARYGGLDNRGGPPLTPMMGSASAEALAYAADSGDSPILRSLREIVGYQIEALDGPLGVAEDFTIDDQGWVARYVAVDTKSWKPGRVVLVPPEWVETVSWGERRIHLKINRNKVRTSQRADGGSHGG